MSLLQFPSGVTISFAASGTTGTIVGDVSTFTVQAGMTLSVGSRNGETAPSKIIASWNSTGTTGGTVVVAEAFSSSAISSAPFVVNTLAFTGSATGLAVGTMARIVSAFASILGIGTSVDSASKTLVLDRQNDGTGSTGKIVHSVLGRLWFQISHRSPSTGTHRWAVQTSPDGSTLIDSLTIESATGTMDFLSGNTTVASAAICDIGAVPFRQVNITGTTAITSFGSGVNKERLILFLGPMTLTHGAALVCLGSANILTQAGDTASVSSDGAGNWKIRDYVRGTGKPLFYTFPVMGNSGPTTVPVSATRYVTDGKIDSAASTVYVAMPLAGTFRNLRMVAQAGAGAGQSWVCTLMNLFSDTALTCAIAGAVDNTGSDLGHAVHFAAGDRWCIKIVSSSGVPVVGNFLFSMTFDPD